MTGVPASAAGGTGAAPAPGGKLGTPARPAPALWNIANILTMVRLLLVPGFVVLMLQGGGYDPAWRSLAWAAFAIAMITDLFDGHLARMYNLVTNFGKIADPIADKAIMGAALVCLSALGDLPWWVTGVILFRELGITLMRFWVIRHAVIPASRGGKMKTLAQGIAVGMYVLALTGPLATLRFWVMAVAVVLTVVTGLDYVRQAVVLRRNGLAAERAAAREASAQETAVREAGRALAAEPVASESVASEPGASGSLAADSAASEPVAHAPVAGEPAVPEPAVRAQASAEPAAGAEPAAQESARRERG
ncbi:CDP-diacylglycerol--glycerol-3-phosphate 3-phosphatidyltransferase [Streptomyces sp. GC420]|uniref:CDP-diacylglycerol--glycerol-3-phosphate 3-phosphatidyltransferase n=1 Tax=Streptomyces sp. GC420 TaxID=2697568 RepID=UPI001414FB48|nr:CDP-diacylglycerol--glycerol-3-phosphate 3-phosphatidyltransferase [Streptomyces sp. GC420]NBM17419.1 CDP-diacylglycerol--glycerol-3-phosphate 3-phosphatidyltransferase [Streptomyces sp. GC420]